MPLPRPLTQWFRQILRGGLQAAAAEELAEIYGHTLDAQGKTYQKGLELVRITKEARESNDPAEREFAEAFLAEARMTLREEMSLGRFEAGEGTRNGHQETAQSPLSCSLPATSNVSEQLSMNGNGASLKALPTPSSTSDVTLLPQNSPRRGRPPGSKNKSRFEPKPANGPTGSTAND